MNAPTTNDALRIIREFAADCDLDCEPGARRNELVLALPGEAKLKTVVSFLVGESAVSLSAFVIRRPDENHARFYSYLLGKNFRLPGVAYAIDRLGDVYVTGRLPLAAVDPTALDAVCGALLTACDQAFNELLMIGFISSMRKEWRWRVARGESLANLEAFRAILEPSLDASNPDVDAKSATPQEQRP